MKNVLERDYRQGEYDVIRAQVLSGWDDDIQLCDIVAIVYATKTTGLSITKDAADTIFEHVDLNKNGFITAMEFQEALHDPSLQQLLKTLKQPALLRMLKNPTVRCRLCYSPPAVNRRLHIYPDPRSAHPPLLHTLTVRSLYQCFNAFRFAPDSVFASLSTAYIQKAFKKIHREAAARHIDLGTSVESGDAPPSATSEDGELRLNQAMFLDWLVGMRKERLKYYMKNMLIKQKCFMGFGMRHDAHRGSCMRCCAAYCCCCMNRGLLEDFVVHAANHHPFFSPWFAHKDHPYSRNEKFVALYVSTMTTFFGTGLCIVAFAGASWIGLILLNILLATLPTMIMTKIMYYMMACPCAQHDESASSDCKNWCLARLEGFGHSCSKILLLIGATLMLFGIIFFIGTDDPAVGFYAFFSSYFQAQLLWFAVKFSTEFNPFKSVAFCADKCTCGLLGFGKWHRQRDKVLGIVRQVIKDRGEGYLLIEDKDLHSSLHSPKKETAQNEQPISDVEAGNLPSASAKIVEDVLGAAEEAPAPAAEGATPPVVEAVPPAVEAASPAAGGVEAEEEEAEEAEEKATEAP